MVDESSNIHLNVVTLPTRKKRKANDISRNTDPNSHVKPGFIKKSPKKLQGILKSLKQNEEIKSSKSVWKHFKEESKSLKPSVIVKPSFVQTNHKHVKDEELKSMSKNTSFVQTGLTLNTHEANSETVKHKSGLDTRKPLKVGHNSSKITSLFGNNPEIPNVPHRAVKPIKEAVFSSVCFKETDLHPYMVKNLKDSMHLTKMTTVQQKSIPVLLKGKDALIRSQTGSGKTLSFALPILNSLQGIRPKINRADGVLALIIVPSRELALQTYEVFDKLVKSYTWLVPGYLIGGERRKSEKARLRKGVSILIGTPGRLVDHVQNTKALKLDKVCWLVLDEADRLLDLGYEKDVASLVSALNDDSSSGSLLRPSYFPDEKTLTKIKNRQTVLLSATLTPSVERLAGLTLKDAVFVDACDETVSTSSASCVPVFDEVIAVQTLVLPESLTQKYVVTPAKLRLVTLVSLILWKCKLTNDKKLLIFIATQDMVDYHAELLSAALSLTSQEDSDEEVDGFCFTNSNIELFKLHGSMNQAERTDVFRTFRKASSGVLLCTDVASRGLDLPEVDWVVQYTGPTSVQDYVHRVGRTARGGRPGSSIVFLAPSEVRFISKLENSRIRIQEEKMESCLEKLLSVNPEVRNLEEAATKLQLVFESIVASQRKMKELACKAYSSWARFYSSYPRNMRDSFSVKAIHLGHYAKSFALRDPPSVIIGHAKRKAARDPRNREKKRMREKRESRLQDGRKGKPKSRNRSLDVSEFDSGLETPRKKKKMKKT